MIRAVLACCALLLALPAAVPAAPHLPPGGKVAHGGTGGYEASSIARFGRLVGKRPTVYQYFFTPSWKRPQRGSLNWQYGLLETSRMAGVRPMFHLSTAVGGHGRSAITPAGIARGGGDSYLIDLNAMVHATGQVLYLRVMAEQNNWNNPYSAFDAGGRRRGRAHSTRAYRQAFRRIAIVVRGGSGRSIDRRLRRLGMPRLRADVVSLPRPRIAIQWVPFCAGLPHVPGNGPGDYWPGARYVDWVGTDFFANSPNFPCLERFYRDRRWRHKPFVFGEWSLWGRDDPGFVRSLFGWIRSHRRVRMVVYNQGSNYAPLLRLRPRSAAELGRQLRGRLF